VYFNWIEIKLSSCWLLWQRSKVMSTYIYQINISKMSIRIIPFGKLYGNCKNNFCFRSLKFLRKLTKYNFKWNVVFCQFNKKGQKSSNLYIMRRKENIFILFFIICQFLPLRIIILKLSFMSCYLSSFNTMENTKTFSFKLYVSFKNKTLINFIWQSNVFFSRT
jgi:hypothetical protein